MRVGIFGSRDWNNYSEIIRSLTVFIQEIHELGHSELILVHTGTQGAENMITEYIGKTKKFLREKNFKIKEEIVSKNAQVIKDMSVIDSGLEFSLIFSTGDKRTISCKKILKEYGIPFRITEIDK